MQIHLITRHLEVTPALKTTIEEKFERIHRRFQNISNVTVTLHVEKLSHIAEANLHFEGTDIHATAESEDMYNTIDKLIDKITTQLTKHKEKLENHH